MTRVLVIRRERSFSAQELPDENPGRWIERVISITHPFSDAIWQIIEVPDNIRGRDVTRYAEDATR